MGHAREVASVGRKAEGQQKAMLGWWQLSAALLRWQRGRHCGGGSWGVAQKHTGSGSWRCTAVAAQSYAAQCWQLRAGVALREGVENKLHGGRVSCGNKELRRS